MSDPPPPAYYDRPRIPDVFAWIDAMRARQGTFIRSLTDLEAMITGYAAALRVHHLDEGTPQMARHFAFWLAQHTEWSMAEGWARAIDVRTGGDRVRSFDVIFSFIDAYRTLRAKTLATATLGPQHLPTGKRRKAANGLLTPPPLRIDVVQYAPEAFYFLRFHYPDGPETQDFELNLEGKLADVEETRAWAEEEFQLTPADWVTAT